MCISGNPLVSSVGWVLLVSADQQLFISTCTVLESNLIKQALESEFPKLLRLLNELWSRLNQSVAASSATDIPLSVTLDDSQVDGQAPQSFE